MIVAFRVDASLQMGTGHVMRCLTLAGELSRMSWTCHFICRKQPGDLINLIEQRGFETHALQQILEPYDESINNDLPKHATWLGCHWKQDASETVEILKQLRPQWLVSDHYALDILWETALKPYYKNMMVIDDLADRKHDCKILLDQNLGRKRGDYDGLISQKIASLIGPSFALLRPEFAEQKSRSISRRSDGHIRHILVTLGGVDLPNITSRVLGALKDCQLPGNCKVTVVMGATSPWIAKVTSLADELPWQTQIITNATNMAEIMATSDLCIGAAGSTSWERCSLGLPTLTMVIAENQLIGATALEESNASKTIPIDMIEELLPRFIQRLIGSPQTLNSMTRAAASICDAQGASRVASFLTKYTKNR